MSSTRALSALDLAFFVLETRERMSNVGPLAILKLPPRTRNSRAFADRLMRAMLAEPAAAPFDMVYRAPGLQGLPRLETAADEIRALSPMLYSIQNENVFEVPAGYFEGLSSELIGKVKPQQARVVLMRRRTSAFFKYAVAAAFTGVMTLGVFKFTAPETKNTELPSYVIEGQKIKDVDEELAKVSDDEIMKYLEASGSDVKTALVANSVDQNELPSEEDYLLDEKALDKYLNSINLDETKN